MLQLAMSMFHQLFASTNNLVHNFPLIVIDDVIILLAMSMLLFANTINLVNHIVIDGIIQYMYIVQLIMYTTSHEFLSISKLIYSTGKHFLIEHIYFIMKMYQLVYPHYHSCITSLCILYASLSRVYNNTWRLYIHVDIHTHVLLHQFKSTIN